MPSLRGLVFPLHLINLTAMTPRRLIPLVSMLLLASCSGGVAFLNGGNRSSEDRTVTTQVQSEFTYAPYERVLSVYVNNKGLVNYEALQQNREQLDQFNTSLATVDSATYESWSEADQIAFWINAYNSLTLMSIVDETPLKGSIKDILGVWRIRTHPVLNESKTLDNIEHNTLRANFNEPRIHAALVCAALSCPNLRTEPFVGDRLDAQLDEQMRQFLAAPKALKIDREAGVVSLSMIFQWFGDDWTPTYGTNEGFTGSPSERAVLNFVSQYVDDRDRAYLKEGNYQIRYLNYDWALNIQS